MFSVTESTPHRETGTIFADIKGISRFYKNRGDTTEPQGHHCTVSLKRKTARLTAFSMFFFVCEVCCKVYWQEEMNMQELRHQHQHRAKKPTNKGSGNIVQQQIWQEGGGLVNIGAGFVLNTAWCSLFHFGGGWKVVSHVRGRLIKRTSWKGGGGETGKHRNWWLEAGAKDAKGIEEDDGIEAMK